MIYKYAAQEDFSHFASGRVIRSYSHLPAFPVRLASEIFQFSIHLLRKNFKEGPYHLYDPCCGGAYMITTLGLMHGEILGEITGSDIDEQAISLATQNLSLLTPGGLAIRKDELGNLYGKYGKFSHKEALGSISYFEERLSRNIRINAFRADAFQAKQLKRNLTGKNVDLIMADIPYARQTFWHSSEINQSEQLLEALMSVIQKHSLVALISPKKEKIEHPAYQILKQWIVGKRRVRIFQLK